MIEIVVHINTWLGSFLLTPKDDNCRKEIHIKIGYLTFALLGGEGGGRGC